MTRSASQLVGDVRSIVGRKAFAELEQLARAVDAGTLSDLDGSGAMLTRTLIKAAAEAPPQVALSVLELAAAIVPRVPRIDPDMAQEIRERTAERHEAAGRFDVADALYLAPGDKAADDLRHWSHFVTRRAHRIWYEGHRARAVALYEAALARIEQARAKPDLGGAAFAPWERVIEFRWDAGDISAIAALVKRMEAFGQGLSTVDHSAGLSMAVCIALGDVHRAREVLEAAIRENSGYLCVNHSNELLRLADRFNGGAGGPIPARVRAFASVPLELEFEHRFRDEPYRSLWATRHWNETFRATATADARAQWDDRRSRVIASAPQKIARNEGWCPRCLSPEVDFTEPPPRHDGGESGCLVGRPACCRSCAYNFWS